MSTAQELADRLTGREYRNEITKEECAKAKADGLVVVFGYSDDGVELRGAIDDDVSACDGTTLRITATGHLLPSWGDFDEGEAETYFRRKLSGFREIHALWAPPDPACSWAFSTEIPHATFDVMEDGDLYCRGIVFALADVTAEAAAIGRTAPAGG